MCDSGTCASGILDYIESVDSKAYANTRYTIMELSEALTDMQMTRLHRHGQAGVYETVNVSATEWSTTYEDPCFVVGLEV